MEAGQLSMRSKQTGNLGLDRFDVLAVTVLVLACVLVAHLPFAALKFGDGDFDKGARGLSAAIKGDLKWYQVDIHRLPGAVLYYTVPYLMVSTGSTDNSYWRAGVAWNLFWMVISILLIRRAGALLGGPGVGLVAMSTALLSAFPIYYSYTIMAETPAYVAAVIVSYGAIRWLTSEVKPLFSIELCLVTAGLSLMVLSRTNVVLVLPIMIAAGFFARRQLRFLLACTFLTCIAFLIVTVMMLKLPRTRSTAQADNLISVALQGRFQFRTEHWDWRFFQPYPGRADYYAYANLYQSLQAKSANSGIPVWKLQLNWMLNDSRQHPVINLEMFAIRLLAIHTALVNSSPPDAFRLGPLKGTYVYVVFHLLLNAVNYLMVILSIVFIRSRWKEIAFYWSLWGPWVALLIFHAIIYAEPRYLMPGRPGLVLMTSAVAGPYLRRIWKWQISRNSVGPV